jgi:hypothetical protein
MGRFTHAASLTSAAASPGRSRSELGRVEPGAGVRGGMPSGVARFEPSSAQAVRAGGTDTYRLAPAALSPIVNSLTRECEDAQVRQAVTTPLDRLELCSAFVYYHW